MLRQLDINRDPLERRAIEANIAQSQAGTRAQGLAGAAAGAQIAGQLRDDFIKHPQVSDFADTWSSAQQLRASIKSGSAVGAQGAIIKLARIYDPGGVVREGEASVYRGSFGALQAMQNSIKAAKGKGFSPETARDIENLVDDLLQSTLPGLETITDQFTGMAVRNGANPQDVIALPIDMTDLKSLQDRLAARQGVIQFSTIQRPP
jgi:hypothetical protein